MQLPQLKRIRWAVRAALMLGVAASVAANVLHAQPNLISQTISAWPPLALLLTVELTSRIPMHKRSLAALRVGATIAIASIAAWVSYWHMQDVAVRYGETEVSAYLLPISVDGLIIVASVSLVELAGRIRMLEDLRLQAQNATSAAASPSAGQLQFPSPAQREFAHQPVAQVTQPTTVAPAPVASAPVASAPIAQPIPVPSFASSEPEPEPVRRYEPVAAAVSVMTPGTSVGPRVATSPLSGKPLTHNAPGNPATTTKPAQPYVNGSTPPARSSVTVAAVSAPARTIVTSPTNKPAESTTPRQRRPVQETAELADEIEAMHPEISQTELAKRLGISATRLRAVRREAREVRRAASARR